MGSFGAFYGFWKIPLGELRPDLVSWGLYLFKRRYRCLTAAIVVLFDMSQAIGQVSV
jgi:hypothetical protein